jgi:hypothetical protein
MKIPTLKLNDVKSEAYIVLPYEVVKDFDEDTIRAMVLDCLNDFLAASDNVEQLH